MLLVNGCSLTFGMEVGYSGFRLHADELSSAENEYRLLNSWPGQLAKRLNNLPLVNLAITGSSNARIYRETVLAVQRALASRQRPTLVIVGWTSLGRIEVFDKANNCDKQISLRLDGVANLTKYRRLEQYDKDLVQLYLDHYLDHDWYATHLLAHQLGLAAYLQNLGIPFLQFSALANKTSYGAHANYIPETMYETVSVDGVGQFLHPLEKGHKRWADLLESYLRCWMPQFSACYS